MILISEVTLAKLNRVENEHKKFTAIPELTYEYYKAVNILFVFFLQFGTQVEMQENLFQQCF